MRTIYDEQECKVLFEECKEMNMRFDSRLYEMSLNYMSKKTNGIGSSIFPSIIRKFIDAIRPYLIHTAFIHDLEWSLDKDLFRYRAANRNFLYNGKIEINTRYPKMSIKKFHYRMVLYRYYFYLQTVGLFFYGY